VVVIVTDARPRAFVAARRGPRLLAAVAGLGLVALVLRRPGAAAAWRRRALYLAQHVAIHVALALVFAVTLRPGQEPLVSALARRVHDGLSPGMAGYTRKVTIVWSAYFVLMAATSLLLFAFAPFDVWAVFANLATPLAMVLLFVGEYLLRYRLHPEFERATLADAMNAYARRSAAPVDRAP
jgi:uncharacterized membrane protein